MNPTQAIQQLRDVICRQQKGLSTESNYVYWLSCYRAAIRKLPQTLSGEQQLERGLAGLARAHCVAASTQIPYNLACHTAQLARLKGARQWLETAFAIGKTKGLKLMTLADPDLEPLGANRSKT